MIMKKILLSLLLGLLVPSLHAAEASEPKKHPNILLDFQIQHSTFNIPPPPAAAAASPLKNEGR